MSGGWLIVGIVGQALFSTRFLIQWIASEIKKKSVFPVAFWYLSLAGSATLLAYALYRKDPIFIFGQAAGLVVYSRNLILINREKTALQHVEEIE